MSIQCSLAATRLLKGSAAEAVGFARRGLADGRLLEQGDGASFPFMAALTAFSLAEDQEEAGAVFDRALQHARDRGATAALTYVCGTAAIAAWITGDLLRCEQMTREAIDPGFPPGVRAPDPARLPGPGLDGTGGSRRRRPDPPRQRLRPEAAVGVAVHPHRLRRRPAPPPAGPPRSRPKRARLPGRPATCREPPAAPAVAARSRRLPPRPRRHRPSGTAGERTRRPRQTVGTTAARGATRRLEALTQPGSARLAGLAAAETLLAGSPARLERARCQLDLGVAHWAAGHTREARDALQAAYDGAGRCGSVLLAAQAHAQLVATGARPRRQQLTGLQALTASKRRVCELAAGALTNAQIAQRLFVTQTTVEKHLGHAYDYDKLGITSRQGPDLLK